ncbi:phosphoribosylglycinamide formyltransferase 1 [Gammaproteobacteria bacterium]
MIESSPSSLSLVVLVSGSGSNLQALLNACAAGHLPAQVRAVVSNEPTAYALTRANRAGVATEVLSHRDFIGSRNDYDTALAERIERYNPDLVLLAGFMRILTPPFVARFRGRMLNIHPALLPAFRGLHTHARALAARVKEHGASVHFVTEELDGGPVVLQARVPILSGDSEEDLAARVLAQEHLIYPKAVSWFAQGRLRLGEDGRAWFDDQPLPPQGVQYAGM